MNISENIAKLVKYGIDSGLIPECERAYSINLLLDVMKEDSFVEPETLPQIVELEPVLEELLDAAVEKGLCEDSVTYRDLFDTRLMNCITPRPATVIGTFREKYKESPQSATDYFYKFSGDNNYIRRYRCSKDIRWSVPSEYGDIDISINLSKPEKDPKAIAAAKLQAQTSYPKCQLCVENEGYAGRVNHPARENHRIIPITIN